MLIHLTDVLTMQGKTMQIETEYEAERFSGSMGDFPITDKSPVRLEVTNTAEGKAHILGNMTIALETACDRCLASVSTTMDLRFDTDVAAPDTEVDEEESHQFMEGYDLNVDSLVQNEIIVNWPFKILCKEDCKGLCPLCGQNLNMGECGCDTFVPDPRMAVLKDIFESNKEV